MAPNSPAPNQSLVSTTIPPANGNRYANGVNPTSASSSALVSSTSPAQSEPSPTDLLLATPPTVLKFLTLAQPAIHGLTSLVILLNWQGNFFSSLLVLLSWWTICLFGQELIKFGLPALVLAYILFTYLSSFAHRRQGNRLGMTSSSSRLRGKPNPLTPASYAQLLNSSHLLAEHVQQFRLQIMQPIIQSTSFVSNVVGQSAPAYRTIWFTLTSYPFYLALTFFVPMRFILLTLGTLVILWNAPFFCTLRIGLYRSAFVRWICRILLGLVSGGIGLKKELKRTQKGVGVAGMLGGKRAGGDSNVQEKAVKVSGVTTTAEADSAEGDQVQAQFTVFENQRWWVGLDWTHALLPGERASWTDPSLNPANPPTSFVLPPANITYTNSPTRSDPNSRLKRTLEWKWLDPEWKVMRTPEFAVTTNKLSTSSSAQLLSNTLNGPGSPIPEGENSAAAISGLAPSGLVDDDLFTNWVVDEEGWQYGDNHFDKMGPKGGLGKYTRRRAWVRRAGLVEKCERVAGPSTTGNTSTSTTGFGLGTGKVGVGSSSITAPSRETSSSRERGNSSTSTPKKEAGADLRRRKSSTSNSAKRNSLERESSVG